MGAEHQCAVTHAELMASIERLRVASRELKQHERLKVQEQIEEVRWLAEKLEALEPAPTQGGEPSAGDEESCTVTLSQPIAAEGEPSAEELLAMLERSKLPDLERLYWETETNGISRAALVAAWKREREGKS